MKTAPLLIQWFLRASNAWANYRQQLRDVTTQLHFPSVIEWPQPLL